MPSQLGNISEAASNISETASNNASLVERAQLVRAHCLICLNKIIDAPPFCNAIESAIIPGSLSYLFMG
jgi:hypothetical protein